MHVGIIMDGNRRWAKNRHLPSLLGHVEGAKNIEIILEYAYNNGAKILTLYVMSKENFVNRSEEEISHLTKLIEKFAKNIQTTLIKKGIKTIILGNTISLPDSTKKALTDLCKSTQDGKGMLLQLCINYSGRDEIVRAVQKITASNTIVSEKTIQEALDSTSDPDLIIRTGGNNRLSNFLTWQSAYSELYFTDTLWPDFTVEEYQKALNYYNKEQRNFGK